MLTNALLFTALATAPMQEPPRAPVLTNAEACLRDNAAQALRVSGGATDAADFLVRYLCASPVSAASNWQRNTEMLEQMKGMLDGMSHIATQVGEEAADSEADPEAQDFAEAEPSMDFFGKGLEGVTVDDTTGELVVTGEPNSLVTNVIRSQTGALGQIFNDPTPVFLRELAGQLVLEYRGRR